VNTSLVALTAPSVFVTLNFHPFMDGPMSRRMRVSFIVPGVTELITADMDGVGITSSHVDPPLLENSQRTAGEFVEDPVITTWAPILSSLFENN
jgi:hypothetical protein